MSFGLQRALGDASGGPTPASECFPESSKPRAAGIFARASRCSQLGKPFGCPKCGRGFTIKGNMTRHLKYECGQAPRFQCPYCEFRSKQTSNVMSHIRTRHTGEKVYVVHLEYQD
ncbi:zinc finger protein 771-like [Orussus abietinus]|uniref:zinc finger protein 771-like n=1 Tax=Orussus abietinus TaxID=222816 RepID=UPI000C71618D|nr:zinc finger protein 771-like [Orussus abietinus]